MSTATFETAMEPDDLDQPISFEPIFMERIWGGRRLQSEFGKTLPPETRIGEAWEISDRPAAQSVVRSGPLRGKTLHDLWLTEREQIFGDVPASARFPLLIKLLDAREKLSLQVHPPEEVANKLGSDAKTEFWYIAAADEGAELYVGLRSATSPDEFKTALQHGRAADYVHTIGVKSGDAMFLPSGRFHAIGGGNLIVEIQQNSDTTYRVFDWNRRDETGKPRQLHIDQALQCIDFADCRPELVKPQGETLVRHELFEVQKWELSRRREILGRGQFAIVFCLTGAIRCGALKFNKGEFILVPARAQDRELEPIGDGTTILRITIPPPQISG